MSVTRLVVPPGHAIAPGLVLVPAEAAHHARVTRVAPGDAVEILDLEGAVGVGRLAAWQGKGCVVEVDRVERERGEPPEPLVLALGALHTDAFDWAVEKACELGATAVVPVLTGRVQGRRHDRRVVRWQRLADAAVTQCGRSRPPRVAQPAPLAELVAAAVGVRVLADLASTGAAPSVVPDGAGITVLVGPEGGFTAEETDTVRRAGFLSLGLGPRVLRAETAAVAALAAVQLHAGWWSRPR